jgi:tyrosyl-tRNA synthetase
MLQVGGDDQWGNILAGTDLVRRLHQAETYALTFPLITTASGAKMGKTAAGAVWLAADRTSPFDFYQYFVNVDDRDVIPFLKLLTFIPIDEIQRFAELEGAELRTAKQALAAAVTEIVHGKEEAAKAQNAAQAAFGGGATGDLVPTYSISPAAVTAGIKIVDVLHAAGLAASKSVARRLVEQGGVRLGERKVTSVDDVVRPEEIAAEGTLLHAGKKHLRRLVVGE